MIYPVQIREKSNLVQVWHAVGAFKTFGYNQLGMSGGPKLTSLDHRNYTKVLVSSENIVDKYAEDFGISRENAFPIGASCTDILFAPTFRGNGSNLYIIHLRWLISKKLYDNWADKSWGLLLKIHPFV